MIFATESIHSVNIGVIKYINVYFTFIFDTNQRVCQCGITRLFNEKKTASYTLKTNFPSVIYKWDVSQTSSYMKLVI